MEYAMTTDSKISSYATVDTAKEQQLSATTAAQSTSDTKTLSGRYWYLCGPMTGIPQFNFPMFDRYARVLREAGHSIVSPAELDHEKERALAMSSPDGSAANHHGSTWIECLRRDLDIVLADDCLGVLAMPGWTDSAGARWETDCAQRAGKKVCEVQLYADADLVHYIQPIERDIVLARHGKLSDVPMERLAQEAGIAVEGAWA